MQRAIFLLVLCILSATSAFSQSVGINSDASVPDGSAMLDVKSTTKGLLPPRMSLAERNLIASPATGLVVYQTNNVPGLYINNGTPAAPSWKRLIVPDDAPSSKGSQYVYVQLSEGNSDIQNGSALLAAYAYAKTKSPSATNRVVVVIPPGRYNLQSTPLLLDTPYLDIVGMTSDSSAQFIYGAPAALNHGVIEQSADYVKIQNFSVYCYWTVNNMALANSPSAYFPHSNLPNVEVYNCSFKVNTGKGLGMRYGINYSGKYVNCSSSDNSFGAGTGGAASGTFTNCTGDDFSFGGSGGTAGGTFTNCTGGYGSFGSGGTADGIFTNCTGGESAFGSDGGTASGIFTNCIGGTDAFGSNNGTASGIFTNCTGGNYAFAGYRGTSSGTFTNCIGGDSSFGSSGDCSQGKFYYCRGGVEAWGGYTPAVHLNCIRNNTAF